MMTVGILQITPFYEDEVRIEFLNKLGEYRREKSEKIKTKKEQARSVGAGLLLEKMLAEILQLPEEQIKNLKYETGKYGKPYLLDYSDIHFNLSHSGDYVVCAVSDHPVGIDVQEIGKYKEKVAKRFFSEKEIETLEIEKSEEKRCKLFYDIWAGKESYTKWLKTGLTIPLSDFSVDLQHKKVTGNVTCNLSFLDIDEIYACAVAYDKTGEIMVKRFSPDMF